MWLHGLKFVAFAVVAVGVVGAVVMSLWNWLTPAVFGWHTIDFWQAIGLFALGRLLFGGLRGGHGRHGGHGHWRARMAQRWDEMSDEERQRFREGMRRRCGGRHMGHGHDDRGHDRGASESGEGRMGRTPGEQPS